jgi:hypothetical protein
MKKLLFTIILILGACTSNKENLKKQEIQTQQSDSVQQKTAKDKLTRNRNHSLTMNLIERFPSALRTDSIQDKFTYYFQYLLKKSSNLLLIEDANIKDIEEIDGKVFLLVYNDDPAIVGRFLVNSQLSIRLLKELKPTDIDKDCCLVAKVNEIVPIRGGPAVYEKSQNDYVNISFGSTSSTSYFINGELIDFYLLNY